MASSKKRLGRRNPLDLFGSDKSVEPNQETATRPTADVFDAESDAAVSEIRNHESSPTASLSTSEKQEAKLSKQDSRIQNHESGLNERPAAFEFPESQSETPAAQSREEESKFNQSDSRIDNHESGLSALPDGTSNSQAELNKHDSQIQSPESGLMNSLSGNEGNQSDSMTEQKSKSVVTSSVQNENVNPNAPEIKGERINSRFMNKYSEINIHENLPSSAVPSHQEPEAKSVNQDSLNKNQDSGISQARPGNDTEERSLLNDGSALANPRSSNSHLQPGTSTTESRINNHESLKRNPESKINIQQSKKMNPELGESTAPPREHEITRAEPMYSLSARIPESLNDQLDAVVKQTRRSLGRKIRKEVLVAIALEAMLKQVEAAGSWNAVASEQHLRELLNLD